MIFFFFAWMFCDVVALDLWIYTTLSNIIIGMLLSDDRSSFAFLFQLN